ncbi:MAG: hypothetical protein II966_08155 [Lachnospiraceae bacterium]|nr:hypothetical protein [Lachnospiraceae bacterium]
MKGRLGDIAILGGIVLVIFVLIFLKRDAIMERLGVQPKDEMAEEAEDEDIPADEETQADTGRSAFKSKSQTKNKEDADSTGEAEESTEDFTTQESPDAGDGISVKNNVKVSDPLLEANSVKEPEGAAVVPEAGLIENNIIGASWTDIKKNYDYTDFEAEKEDIAQLRFLDDGNLSYYQSPGSGEIFGVQDDTIVAYLKRWNGTPLNEAISVEGLFDVSPYIYQCTDHLNFYEWKIANCYVGIMVEDTGDGVADNAPLYAESYVLQRRINTFYK